MAAARRSCARFPALLSPSSAFVLATRQLPRVAARSSVKRVGALHSTRSFITSAKQGDVESESQSLAPKIDRARSKVYKDADEAVADIQSGSTILSAGFGLCGTAGMNL